MPTMGQNTPGGWLRAAPVENILRHLLADRMEYQYNDPHLARSILLVEPQNDVPAPDWLLDKAMAHSQAVYKQATRTNYFAKTPSPENKGKGRGKKGKKS